MLERLSDRPDFPAFKAFVERVLKEKSGELEFVVLFGSMARGNWSYASDYDVLIGLSVEDGRCFIDRIYEYGLLAERRVEPFVYAPSEIERMFSELHPTLLEALNDGMVLYDRGGWRKLKEQFDRLLRDGVVRRSELGWQIDGKRQGD